MSDVVDQALGQTLRKLRTELGWSQSELALRAQMDRNYLSLIELGRVDVQIRAAHTRGMHAHQHLARAGLRLLHLIEAQALGGLVFLQCLHRL